MRQAAQARPSRPTTGRPRPFRRLAIRALALGSVALLLAVGATSASIPTADGTSYGSYAPGAGRRAVEYGIRTDRGLATQDRSLLMAWLNGNPLLDPRLVSWVSSATMGHPVEGAGRLSAVGAGRRAVEYGIRTDRGLSAQDRSLLMVWLNGNPLSDPRLVAWVNAATMGHPVEGAGTIAHEE